MRFLLPLILVAILSSRAQADTLELTSGRSLDCTIVREDASHVTVLYASGLMRFPRTMVAAVEKAAGEAASVEKTRLPSYESLIVSLGAQTWSANLHQIPATVIDAGVLRRVPYKSHRVAEHVEINVYGDPDAPAGFEMGIHGKLLTSDNAKQACIEFVCSLLSDANDAAILRALRRDEDAATRQGLTFEVTPPSAPDAYGGWWVSVYDLKLLDSVRAGDEELKRITVAKPSASAKDNASSTPNASTGGDDDEVTKLSNWSSVDYQYSRPAASSTSSSGGAVYVRGYYRKDGTYVHAHTRSGPRR